ncbi:hypothetical protein [Leminorella grimontii]|nr:hypothetical protein [Leminorella grimontii]
MALTDGPESYSRIVNLTVVACAGAHYLGKPVSALQKTALFIRKIGDRY